MRHWTELALWACVEQTARVRNKVAVFLFLTVNIASRLSFCLTFGFDLVRVHSVGFLSVLPDGTTCATGLSLVAFDGSCISGVCTAVIIKSK